MNKVDVNRHFNYLQSCGDFIKNTGIFARKALSIAVFALAIIVTIVAHPIIGAAVSIGYLFAAAYHGVLTNYHWRHSCEKDQNGNLIPETELNQSGEQNKKDYRDKNAKLESGDVVRLQNKLKRVYHTNALIESLKEAQYYAKCVIPFAGPCWASWPKLKKDSFL